MDRRKRILNDTELRTERMLLEVANRYHARVFSHVRIADALAIESSGLSRNEYGYAFRAHFDFVIARENTTSVFAVEFDGPLHDHDQKTRQRDSLKKALCCKVGMPLIRIDAAYLQNVERCTLLSWLVEMWFIYEDWCEAQQRGQIPQDEPFTFFSVVGSDPYLPSRARLQRWYEQGHLQDYAPHIDQFADTDGNVTSLATITAVQGGIILGRARCRFFAVPFIPSISPRILSEELAVVDTADKMARHLHGDSQTMAHEAVEKARKHLIEKEGYRPLTDHE